MIARVEHINIFETVQDVSIIVNGGKSFQRGQVVGAKGDYPPPAHRQGGVKDKLTLNSGLPKAEPNLNNLFNYGGYQQPMAFLHHDSSKVKQGLKHSPSPSLLVTKTSSADRDMGLPNPPPLMSDLKSSVIVKNEGQKGSMDKTKLRVSEAHYLPPVSSGATPIKYEYRSPSQSPHLLPHHYDQASNLASISKVHNPNSSTMLLQRSRQSPLPPHRQSPHPPHRQSPHQPSLPHRQSPHGHPQRQSPHSHPHASSPDQRYPPGPLVYNKSATVNSYPYPAPGPTLHYAPTVTTPPKPKVSSPAPPHIYGKPSSGITVGTPICRAPELRLSPLPLTSTKAPLTTSPYHQLPQHHPPPTHQLPSQTSAPAPPPAHSRGIATYAPYQQPQGPGLAVSIKPPPTSPPSRSSPLAAFQTQPLDLGIKEDQDRGASPKRKLVDDLECLDIKKRRSDEPVLSRVSEPSPLLASAATTITTVVNTAVTDSLDRPHSAGTPVPPACSSPNTPAKTISGVDSEKSNSPGPPPRTSSYPVHKLKKAWLERHGQEDGTEDKDVVGSGSCVTLPLTLPKKEIERSENVSAAVNSLHCIGSMAVNSINKPKPKPGRKSAKETPLMNGHTTGKSPDADYSSSSDPDRKASLPKRVPPKVKRKKGGRKPVVEESKRKKLSASSTDSEKESGSEKDSDNSKKAAGGQSDKTGKESGKKRGRRPKTAQSQQPKNEGGK